MNLNDLITLINNNLQDGPGGTKFLVLSNALDTVFGKLVSYLNLTSAQLQVNNVQVSSNASQVQVAGSAYFLDTDNKVTLTGRVIDQQVLLQLTGIPDPPAAWNFNVSFPNLPQYYGTDGMFMRWKDSFFKTLVFSSPVFTLSTYNDSVNAVSEGLNFKANLAIDGPLKGIPIISALSGPLLVSGTIDLTNALEPVILLGAMLPGITFDLGKVRLDRTRLLLEARASNTLLKPFPGNSDDLDDHRYYSIMEMEGHIMIGSLDVTISTPLLQGDFIWPFKAVFPKDALRLQDGLAQLANLVSGTASSFTLPEPVSKWTNFYLSKVAVGIDPSDPSLNFISLTVSSPEKYNPPVPKLSITDVSITWLFAFPTDPEFSNMSGTLRGTFEFGSTPPVRLDTSLTIPDFEIVCELREGDVIKVTDAFKYYFGYSGSLPQINITALRMLTQLRQLNFVFYGEVDLGWPLDIGSVHLSLEQLIAEVNYGSSVWSGKITAIWMLGDKRFLISAESKASGFWTFRGELYPGDVIDLGEIVTKFLNFQPGILPVLGVEGIAIWFENEDNTLGFKGQTAGFWTYQLSNDITLRMKASVYIERKKNLPYSGNISGVFMINDLLLGATYKFEQNSTTLIFLIKYKKLELSATLTNKVDKITQKKQSILTIGFGDMTFGDIVTYLAGLANPNVQVTLEGPWSVLYDINFKNLTITINLDTKEVGVWYSIGVNLVFVSIDAIGLVYKKQKGKGKVFVQIKGRFLDQTFGEDDPLQWDLLEDSPPEVPGKESAFVDLRFVGIGQHVAIDRPGEFQNVEEVINALRDEMLPPDQSADNPLQQLHGLKFDENSHWLFGLDMTIIGAVRLAVVFNDPTLNGLLIALSGDRVGSMAGLKFEVLYVKITDDIGVFKIELRVPDAFRQLEFGEVSVTLPVIKLDIYTNGNFKVDLGFPKGSDFSESFCLQVFPFIGYGGFYFAYLTGATSKRVPQISNGIFNPVIEFGFGLAVGVGKTIEKGPFKAGLSITVVGILQGSLAWFNPTDKSLPAPMYYWAQGTIAIVGKLYGEVDFKIISVRISVEAQASATLIIEAYSPIYIEFKVGVSVNASVKIIFITIHFSFSIELKEDFTIGTQKPTPWIAGPPAAATAKIDARSLRMQRSMVRSLKEMRHSVAVRAQQTHNLRLHLAGLHVDTTLVWNPRLLVFGAVENLHFTMTPFFTVAMSGSAPAVEVVMVLTTENTIAPEARNSIEIRAVSTEHSARVNDAAGSPFNKMMQAILAYAIDAFPRADKTVIQADDLQHLFNLMQQPGIEEQGFSYDNLCTFMLTNFMFQVSGIPQSGNQVSPTSPSDSSAALFPMIPELIMEIMYTATTVNFKDGPYKVDKQYEDYIAAYFKQLGIGYLDNVAKDPLQTSNVSAPGNTLTTADKESLSVMVFRDYFLMMARAAVQEAIDLMQTYPYTVNEGESLFSIANNPVFPKLLLEYEVKMGDTWQSVADHFGMTILRLQELNPAVPPNKPLVPPLDLVVEAGVTVPEIAAANQNKTLNPLLPLVLSGIKYQVKSTDKPGAIAVGFGQTAAALSDFNSAVIGILQQGQSMLIAQPPAVNNVYSEFKYTTVQGDTLALVAAGFLTRNNNPAVTPSLLDPDQFQWYAQAIANLNPQQDQLPPAGTILFIPKAYLDSNSADAISYTTRAWDTLDFIAGYFVLVQNPTTRFNQYSLQITNLNPGVDWNNLLPGTVLNIPKLDRIIQGNDTLSSIGALYGISAADLGTVNADSGTLLATLAVLAIPPVSYTTVAGDTISGIAGTYNLTIEELALNIATVSNIFPYVTIGTPPGPLTTIIIPDVPKITVSRLMLDVVMNGHSNNIAAMTSRFLLHGLRLPVPPVGGAQNAFLLDPILEALYLLTGQQFAAPADTSQNYTIQFTVDSGTRWIEFANSYTVQPGDTKASLSLEFPDIVVLNPNTDWSKLKPGMVLLTSLVPVTGNLPVVITPAMMSDNYPSVLFKPVFNDPLPSKLFNEHPLRYTLQEYLHWQTALNLSFPTIDREPPLPPLPPPPKAGEPGIWIFPSALTQKLTRGQFTGKDFELGYLTGKEEKFDNPPKPQYYKWAILASINVTTVADTANPGHVLANTYECNGADEANRQLLLQVWTYLNTVSADNADIKILYPPNATGGNPGGLSSSNMDGAKTYILKTNLSTETTSGGMKTAAQAAMLPLPGNYVAGINTPVEFLKFLWEGAITGTGGYYLTYTNTDGGLGLPGTVFDQSGNGKLWLAITLTSQDDAGNANYRKLQPFNNCAIVGDNLDPSTMNVFAHVADNTDLIRVANVQPGNTGFDMTMANPVPADNAAMDPELRTRILYSMLGYQVADSGPFGVSNQGLPIGPLEPGNSSNSKKENTDTFPWYFHQIIPIAKFAKAHLLPSCPALPDPMSDPYAGIMVDNLGKLGKATLNLAFYDVFGNSIQPDPVHPLVSPDLPIGYFDDIIGLSQWPGLSADYLFSQDIPGDPFLHIYLAFQLDNYIPGPGLAFEKAEYNSSAHWERYKQVYYQVQQPDLAFMASTSLVQTAAIIPLDTIYPVEKGPVLGFVNAVCVFLNTTQQLSKGQHLIITNDTLQLIADSYTVTFSDLAMLNAEARVVDVFLNNVNVPSYFVTGRGESLNTIVAKANESSPPNPVTALDIVNNSLTAILNGQTELIVPSRTVILSSDPLVTAALSLQKIAKQQYCSVTGIANANYNVIPTIINKDILLTLGDLSYTTAENETFENITAKFNAQGSSVNEGNSQPYTVDDIAVANKDVQNLFTIAASLTISDYLTSSGDSFYAIGILFPQFTPAAILGFAENLLVTNLYTQGQALLMFSKTELPLPNDTIASMSASWDITPEQLFEQNKLTLLQTVNHGSPDRPTNSVTIPNLVAINPAVSRNSYAPYQSKTGDYLAGIAAIFYGTENDVMQLATLNQHITWMFKPDQSITISGKSIQTQAADSMQAIIDRFFQQYGITVSLQSLVDEIKTSVSLLSDGAFFVCPLPNTGATNTLAGLAQIFNVPVTTIARVNSSLEGFLANTGTVSVQRVVNGQPVDISINLQANDTFYALILRFSQEKQVETSVDEIASYNKGQNILAANRFFLLPPNQLNISQNLGAGYPDHSRYPGTLFEVKVDFIIERDKDNKGLINPDFVNVAAVKANTAPLAPQSTYDQTGQLSLAGFALSFESAFPNLKAAVASEGGKTSSSSAVRHIWALCFGAKGISKFEIDRIHPHYYALRPLSTTLISRSNVPVQSYAGGELTVSDKRSFQSIDMEVWARQFLEAVEQFLTPAWASAASQLQNAANGFNRVVEAKRTLAGKISGGLDYILAETIDAAKLESARRSIKEQLLINLSKAYQTDALLQYDIGVEANFTGQPIPPRLSGKAVSNLYQTYPADQGAKNTIAQLSIDLSVSQIYFATTVASLKGILNTGITVSYPAKPDYTIAPGDTISTLLTLFQVSLQDIVNNLTWNKPTVQGLFLADTTISVTSISTVTAARTIAGIAAYFNVDVDEWATANKDNTGLFQVGKPVPYPGHTSVPVTAENNTLGKIAVALGQPVVSAEALADYLRLQTGLLNPLFTSYMLVANLNYSISTAKTSLLTGTSEANFMLNIVSAEKRRKALLNLNYVVDELEFNIASQTQDYQSSSWLTFLVPIKRGTQIINNSLGEPEIPLPLRSYPSAPTMIAQTGVASIDGKHIAKQFPDNINGAKLWKYAFSYMHTDAEQDTGYLHLWFNLDEAANLRSFAVADAPDFFDNLAQFISVWPQLLTDLTALPDGGYSPVTAKAVNTFATLAENIADTWGYNQTNLLKRSMLSIEFKYALSSTTAINAEGKLIWKTLILTPVQNDVSPTGTYPDIFWVDDSLKQPQEHILRKDAGSTDCVYTYLEDVLVSKPIEHKLVFDGLDLIKYQNALAGAYVMRNAYLVEVKTNDQFIYRTPEVVFNQTMFPFVEQQVSLPFRNNQPDIQHALQGLFSTLLGTQTPAVKISGLYGYKLAVAEGPGEQDDSNAIISLLPIVFRPTTDFNSGMIDDLTLAINAWAQGKIISQTGGRYTFDLYVFSEHSTTFARPILRLKNLVYYF